MYKICFCLSNIEIYLVPKMLQTGQDVFKFLLIKISIRPTSEGFFRPTIPLFLFGNICGSVITDKGV